MGRLRFRTGSRLFAVYAVASLVPVLVLGLVLLRGYRHEAHDRALAQARAQAAVIGDMAIAPSIGRHDLRKGLRPDERARLLDATELAIFSGSVVRLRLRDFDGGVAFSDDGRASRPPSALDAAFVAAARGGGDVAIVADPTDGRGRVLRVLQPIVPNASGQATGVLEVYLPYAPIAQRVQAQLHRSYWRMGIALLGLYLVLALISWSSTRRLRRHAAEREHQALHDPLTGLPNREAFRLRAQRAVQRGPDGEHGAIVLIDLDRFKEVNDTLGHHAGDELLQVVAQRLSESLRTDDLVARLGGDEFGLVLTEIGAAEQAVELLDRVRDELSAAVTLDEVEVGVEASFGIALFPAHGTTVEELLKHADTAMYRGKRGTAGIVVFEPGEEEVSATRSLVTKGELRHALERDELLLHYQPKLDLRTGRVCGVEALLRWQHPQRGLLAPGAFLPAVEHSGLIEPLTAWVVRRALADREGWLAAGADWGVSVNVSARNLESVTFTAEIMRQLEASATAPHELCLEITETAIAGDAELATLAFDALSREGVYVSVDDFGMGYTSLSQLRHLPVAEIKIDRAFVMDLDDSSQDRAIVRAIIDLGHGLGCTVTAEGVETAATADWLRAAGCDSAQGFHFARPLPWPELLERFRSAAPGFQLATTVP